MRGTNKEHVIVSDRSGVETYIVGDVDPIPQSTHVNRFQEKQLKKEVIRSRIHTHRTRVMARRFREKVDEREGKRLIPPQQQSMMK